MVWFKCIIIFILTKQLLQVLDKVKLKPDKRLKNYSVSKQLTFNMLFLDFLQRN